jgi:hypothetical protein
MPSRGGAQPKQSQRLEQSSRRRRFLRERESTDEGGQEEDEQDRKKGHLAGLVEVAILQTDPEVGARQV